MARAIASLLDNYHAERHPAAARALQYTMAMSALQRQDPRTTAVRDLMDRLVGMDGPRQVVAGLVSGLDVHDDLGEGHPLLRRHVPDLDLVIGGVRVRLYSLLHSARPPLIDLAGSDGVALGPWESRVRRVDASYADLRTLPGVGAVDPPSAVLVRPDGHVAWVEDGTDAGLEAALSTWFGPAAGQVG